MGTNTVRIDDIFIAFQNAVNNPENLDERGDINWNLVDADIQFDAEESGLELPEDYYTIFNDLADEFELSWLQERV